MGLNTLTIIATVITLVPVILIIRTAITMVIEKRLN